MANVKKNLGYRLVLKDADFPAVARAREQYTFTINIENVGYASPFNERPVLLILKRNQKTFSIPLDTDIRKWYTGKTKLQVSVTFPADIEKGKYDLFLFMPDQYASLAQRPEYAIRLAYEGLWEEVTG